MVLKRTGLLSNCEQMLTPMSSDKEGHLLGGFGGIVPATSLPTSNSACQNVGCQNASCAMVIVAISNAQIQVVLALILQLLCQQPRPICQEYTSVDSCSLLSV